MTQGKTHELQGQWMDGLHGSTAGVIYNLDSAGRTAYVSTSVREVLGFDPAELRQRPIFDIVHPEDQESVRAALIQTLHGATEVDLEFRASHADGRELYVEATMVRAEHDPNHPGVILRFKDVTERKKTELELREMASWFQALTKNSGDVIFVVDAEDRHRFVSGSSEAVLGWSPDELTAELFNDSIHPHDRMGAILVLESVRHAPGDQARTEYRLKHRDGRWLHVETTVVNRFDDPVVQGLIFYTRDVTEKRLRDDLTELPNRLLFTDQLQAELTGGGGDGSFCVALFELDRHDLVKGSLGPELADKMVVQFARRLQRAAEPSWTVARLQGAEFAVLITPLDTPQDGARHAQALGGTVGEAFHLAGQEIYSGVTVGLALSARRYSRADAMLRDAEGALRKARGGGGEAVANTEMIQSQAARLILEGDLVGAVKRHELSVHYQPIFDVAGGKPAGCEALVRWNHPRDGMLSPARFIPLAEETGLIVPIGEHVLRRACQQAIRWDERFPMLAGGTMSVNLSPIQIADSHLLEKVEQVLKETGLAPERLKLEVTETVLIDRPGFAARVLSQLKDLGVQLSLDDFGTGFSSLSYLSNYQFDDLKVDRSFVSGPRGMEQSSRATDLVRAIIQLGHTMGMRVTAEGIEEQSQLVALKELDCDLAQGYFLAKPMGAKMLRQSLSTSR